MTLRLSLLAILLLRSVVVGVLASRLQRRTFRREDWLTRVCGPSSNYGESFEEALRELNKYDVDYWMKDSRARLDAGVAKCLETSGAHDLTWDEAASIFAYSGSTHQELNSILDQGSEGSLNHRACYYSWLLTRALAKFPASSERIVYRGTPRRKLMRARKLAVGDVVNWRHFLSTSTSRATGTRFLSQGMSLGRLYVIQLRDGSRARFIEACANHPEEMEMLLPLVSRFVVSNVSSSAGIDEIQLMETSDDEIQPNENATQAGNLLSVDTDSSQQ